MAAERIRNRTRVAMLCYAMLCYGWIPRLEPIAISVSSIFPDSPISHRPPVQLVQPGQCRHAALSTISLPPSLPLSLSLPISISFRFPFSSSPQKRTAIESMLSICPSAIDRSLIPFLFLSLDPKNHEDTAGKKTWFITRTLSFSLSPPVRPSVRVKDSFLFIPFVRAYLGGHVRFRLYILYSARVYDMIRYDTIRYVTSLAAKLACFACVPDPHLCPSIHLSICPSRFVSAARVVVSRSLFPACACVSVWSVLYASLFACICMYVDMYVCIWICMNVCMHVYVYVYVYGYLHMYVDLYRYSMPSQPASQPESKEKRSSCHTLRTRYEHVPYRAHHTHTTLYTAAYAPITIINNNNDNNHRGLMMILTARIVRTVRYPASRPCSQHCSLYSL